MSPAAARFTLELGDGEFVVGDHLPGASPGYLFLHGLGSVRAGEKSASLFAHAAATGRACTRFDLRGHGESSGVLGQIEVGQLVRDTERVLARFGAAHVVGSSLGGIVGAMVAAAVPERVAGLALLAPALGFLPELHRLLDRDGWLWTQQGRGFPVAANVLAEAAAFDEASLPQRLRMPVLLVHGTADDVVPHGRSERFFAAIRHPRKELWIVSGGDHRLATQAAAIWPRLDRLTDRTS